MGNDEGQSRDKRVHIDPVTVGEGAKRMVETVLGEPLPPDTVIVNVSISSNSGGSVVVRSAEFAENPDGASVADLEPMAKRKPSAYKQKH